MTVFLSWAIWTTRTGGWDICVLFHVCYLVKRILSSACFISRIFKLSYYTTIYKNGDHMTAYTGGIGRHAGSWEPFYVINLTTYPTI